MECWIHWLSSTQSPPRLYLSYQTNLKQQPCRIVQKQESVSSSSHESSSPLNQLVSLEVEWQHSDKHYHVPSHNVPPVQMIEHFQKVIYVVANKKGILNKFMR